MSNKNLKVYRIEFITEVRDMQFKVKFPCQVKMIWKRSNESAETSLVPVQNGIVHFNQTLKMYVNMYFDTTNNKFVQKKCMYSFLIITDKGQKSAGSVTYDLAEFFNKRIYDVQQDFVLQKCPLPDTKVRMKIYYQQSSEQGYDSMSRISTSQQLDLSTASMDLTQLHNQSSVQKQTKGKSGSNLQQNKSRASQSDTASKQKSQKDKQQVQSNMDVLNQSDLGEGMEVNLGINSGISVNEKNEKIASNIQAINKISGKINDFVSKCSGNIKTQIQNIKHKNKTLQQSLLASKFQVQKLTKQKQQYKTTILSLKKQLSDQKLNHQTFQKAYNQKYEQLQHKYEQSHKLCTQLENNLSQKGQSQNSYVNELKLSFAQTQRKQKQKIQSLNSEIVGEKKQKNELSEEIAKLSSKLKQMKQRQAELLEKNKAYQARESQREKQLADLRYKLQNVYEDVVKALGSIGVGN